MDNPIHAGATSSGPSRWPCETGNTKRTDMSGYWDIPDDYQIEPQITHGSAHSVSSDIPDNTIERLLNAVEDATGKPVARSERKIGFV